MNSGEIPARFGVSKEYLIFVLAYICIIIILILVAIVSAFIFGMVSNISATKIVAFTAEESRESIIITNQGGHDVGEIETVYVSLNNGPKLNKTLELMHVGDSTKLKKETQNDKVKVMIKFSDGSEALVLDYTSEPSTVVNINRGEGNPTVNKNAPTPIAYYSFDDGTVRDISGNQLNGVMIGGNIVDGIYGKALELNGISDYVELPNLFSEYPKSITYMALICPDLQKNSQNMYEDKGIVFFNGKYHSTFGVRYDGEVSLGTKLVSDDPYGTWYWVNSNKIDINGNSWVHVTGVIDTNMQKEKIYINGKLINEINLPNSDIIFLDPYSVTIGSYKGDWEGNKDYYRGLVDEIQIFDKSLSDSEIFSKYKEYTIPNSNNLSLTITSCKI